MSETTQQEKTTQLASRNETTQLVSRNETTQLCTAVDRLQPPTTACSRLPPTTAYNRLQPPTTAYRLQPPATACNRLPCRLYSRIRPLQPPATAFLQELHPELLTEVPTLVLVTAGPDISAGGLGMVVPSLGLADPLIFLLLTFFSGVP
ncbi:hypothetical protein TNCV_63171 [Trichonephila clavipes]|nr:hypothetical protein TNCV_63171 [Trichonephila clavipes]